MKSSFEKTIFESVTCDVCLCPRSRTVYSFVVRDQTTNIVRCTACGLCYLNPRPTAESVKSFYGESYYSYTLRDYTGAPPSRKERLKFAYMVDWRGFKPGPAIDPLPVPRLVSWLLSLFLAIPRFQQGGRLLDVGCGAGEKLIEFRRFGWQVAGVELSEAAAAEGTRGGLEIHTGFDADDPPFPDQTFDAITFYHSLEHMPSPLAALRLAHRLLRPGGEVIIVVPNFGSLERRIFGKDWGWMEIPIHFYHFTKPSLARLVRDAGFEIETIGNSFTGRSICRPASGPLRPLSQLVMALAGPFGVLCAMVSSGKAIIVSARRRTTDGRSVP
jgi:SAM-dependent methyltransferase